MSLNDLNRKIYKEDSEIEKREHEKDSFDPSIVSSSRDEEFKKEKFWEREEKGLRPEQKQIIKKGIMAVGLVAAFVMLGVLVVKIKQSAFNEKRVKVTIEGPEVVDSTQTMSYRVKYENDNRVDLKDAKLRFNYSENFRPEDTLNFKHENHANGRIDLGNIDARARGEFEIKGKFYAPRDHTVYLNVTLSYVPSNLDSVFEAKTRLGVNVQTSPLFLEVVAPLETSRGNQVEYVIDYRNISDQSFDNLRIKVDYPEGFVFSSADPHPSEGEVFWYLGTVNSRQGGKIRVTGSLNGDRGQQKIIQASIGAIKESGEFLAYNTRQEKTKLVGSPLFISQEINGLKNANVNPGETLYYTIDYRNDGNVGLRDVIITVDFESRVLDFSRLELRSGSYDVFKNKFTWKASDLPELFNLAPGAKGKISFSVPILGQIPVKGENDENFRIISVASIDSPDIPNPLNANKIVSSNRIEAKLNSRVVLQALGYYKNEQIQNSGPLPPEVGKETSYVISWKVINVSNDISDTEVVSSLPSGVKWTGKFYPSQESIFFNERTNQIIWKIGNLKNGTGILDSPREVNFQISFAPQENQVGNTAVLLNPSVLKARDIFTGADVRVETKEKTTNLPEDSFISATGYRIIRSGN